MAIFTILPFLSSKAIILNLRGIAVVILNEALQLFSAAEEKNPIISIGCGTEILSPLPAESE
jgi:hypothetical protein